jgi:hypothetical protein
MNSVSAARTSSTGCQATPGEHDLGLLLVDLQERPPTFGGVGRVEGSFVLGEDSDLLPPSC